MKLKNVMTWSVAAVALAGIGGCAKKAVDIGDDRPPGVLGASLSDYAGTWVGYAELAMWNDGTDSVRLMLDQSGNGVIEVGEAEPLPPPVFDQAYPPPTGDTSGMRPYETAVGLILSGFSYPVEGAVVESNRIRMSSSSAELYSEWCAQQTPSLAEGTFPETYTCLGTSGFAETQEGCFIGPESMTPIECGRLGCLFACTCDETSCGPQQSGPDIRLDAALESEGEELEGSFETPLGRFQVRMTRE